MNVETVGKLVVVLLILVIIAIVTILVKLIMDKQFQNSISQAKLALTSGIEKRDGKDYCYMVISNRSFSNVIVESLGFKDRLKETDYIKKYKEDHSIRDEQSVVLLARSSIRLEVEFDEVYNLYASYKIDKIKCFTIDSLGFRRDKKCKIIRKSIKIIATPIFKEKLRVEKLELKELKKQAKLNGVPFEKPKAKESQNEECNEKIEMPFNEEALENVDNASISEVANEVINEKVTFEEADEVVTEDLAVEDVSIEEEIELPSVDSEQ